MPMCFLPRSTSFYKPDEHNISDAMNRKKEKTYCSKHVSKLESSEFRASRFYHYHFPANFPRDHRKRQHPPGVGLLLHETLQKARIIRVGKADENRDTRKLAICDRHRRRRPISTAIVTGILPRDFDSRLLFIFSETKSFSSFAFYT